jgi:hypothetical protein
LPKILYPKSYYAIIVISSGGKSMAHYYTNRKVIVTLLISLSIITSNVHTGGIVDSTKKVVGGLLCLPFGQSKASEETTQYVNSVMKELNPKEKVTEVRQMSKLAQYMFGYQNIIALPYLNYVLVNEQWLKKLPDDAKKFLIGRTLVHLSQADQYAFKKYVLPFLIHIALEASKSDKYKNFEEWLKHSTGNDWEWISRGRIPINAPEEFEQSLREFSLGYPLSVLAHLITSMASRSAEYNADIQAATKLKCAKGGITLLKDTLDFKHDKTILGSTLSRINPLTKNHDWGIIHRVLSYVKHYAPGQLTNAPDQLTHFLTNLPLFHYWSSYPRTSDRIKELEKLVKKQEKKQKPKRLS